MEEFKVTTHELTLPVSKYKVVLKDWISGYDNEQIQSIYFEDKTPRDVNGVKEYSAETMIKADREGLKRCVVSVNGVTENVADIIKKLPLRDNVVLAEEVKKILDPLEPEQTPTA